MISGITQKRQRLNYNVLFYFFLYSYMPDWLVRCLRFYVIFSTFVDNIQFFDSDSLLCRNCLLVFS